MKKLTVALIATAASLLSTASMAQSYVGAAVGAGHADIDCSGAAVCDKTTTAFKIVGGYGFGNGLAAELGYINFGKAHAADTGISADAKADGILLGLAYNAQLGTAWGASARAGVARLKTTLSGTVAGLGSGSDSETSTTPYVGFGVNYALSKNAKIELGADFSRAKYADEKIDVRAVTVGVRFDF